MTLLVGGAASDLSFHFPYLGFAFCATAIAANSISATNRFNLRIPLLYAEVRMHIPQSAGGATSPILLVKWTTCPKALFTGRKLVIAGLCKLVAALRARIQQVDWSRDLHELCACC